MSDFNPLTPEAAAAPEAITETTPDPVAVDAADVSHGTLEEATPEGASEAAPEASPEVSPEVAPEVADGADAKPIGKDKVDEWSKRFDALSRRDIELRAREKDIKEAQTEIGHLEEFKRLLKANPAEAVAKLGLTMDDIYKHQVQDKVDDPSARLAEMEKSQAVRMEEMEAKMRGMEMQRLGDQWELKFLPTLASEEYAIVREWEGGTDIVRQHVAQNYHQNGNLLTPKEALDTIKAELESRLGKLRESGFFGGGSAGQADQPKPPAAVHSGPKTVTPTLASAPSRADSWLDDESEMARIAAKYI